MMDYQPDYTYLEKAARNLQPGRIPLYEHLIDIAKMEDILGVSFGHLYKGNREDIREFFSRYCQFFKTMTYDTVSFECIVTEVMPGSGALYANKDGCIRNMDDFRKYPWNDIPPLYFQQNRKYFDAFAEALPCGMKGVGGVGNGVLECVQDIVGYINLCFISADDPVLYQMLFEKAGQVLMQIWEEFMNRYAQSFCVLRFGDDLGYKSQTLLSRDDTINLVIPQYEPIIRLVHSYEKPFLLHSCGNTFSVMDALIAAGIDAKHSNEDAIAPMKVWYEKYSSRIGNFGGIDTDILIRDDPELIRTYVSDVCRLASCHGGVALGSGSSIADYVPTAQYITMVESINEFRLNRTGFSPTKQETC